MSEKLTGDGTLDFDWQPLSSNLQGLAGHGRNASPNHCGPNISLFLVRFTLRKPGLPSFILQQIFIKSLLCFPAGQTEGRQESAPCFQGRATELENSPSRGSGLTRLVPLQGYRATNGFLMSCHLLLQIAGHRCQGDWDLARALPLRSLVF